MVNGINQEETIKEEDINNSAGFTGYHKKVTIKDYVLVVNDSTKQPNLVKRIDVDISYKLGKEEKNIKISTYISRF